MIEGAVRTKSFRYHSGQEPTLNFSDKEVYKI